MSETTTERLETAVAKPEHDFKRFLPDPNAKPKITPSCVFLQYNDPLVYRHFKVILPKGIVRQDLHDYPELWRAAQADVNTALRGDDHLFVVSHDRSWAASYVVISASSKGTVLNSGTLEWSKQEPLGLEWEDETHEIEWAGNGYAVFRKAKGNKPRLQLASGFATVDAAKIDVQNRYPRRL